MNPAFTKDFLWGAATAAYQIEGSVDAEGRGPSIWDAFAHEPGKTFLGHTGDVACDHYRRVAGDVGIMQQLGLQAYRFSISWTRVLPEGRGRVNQAGLDFYSRLVDQLLEARIRPFATLFHWDYPLELYHRGGWLNPDSPQWFADYAAVVGAALSDRVKDWVTLNEPQCFLGLGHQQGDHAPGLRLPFAAVLRAGHHALLGHGLSVAALRACASDLRVGIAPVGRPRIPFTDSPEDLSAAREATFTTVDHNCWSNAWWMDPVYLGRYPEDGLSAFESMLPPIAADDLRTIAQPLDFFGVNTYQGDVVRRAADGTVERMPELPGTPRTAFNWPITPEALYWGPRFFHERYGLPVIVLENGLSCRDWVSLDGAVHDPSRIDFLARHLGQLRRAIEDGAAVAGYFHWSLFDNFEWAEGYKHRFGLVHVDYQTQGRTLKDSARWFREVIETNGANIPLA